MSAALDVAVARHRGGDVAGARRAARAALEIAPDDPALLHFLGMIEARAGARDAARQLFECALSAAGGYGPALVSLARLFAQADDWQPLAALGQPAPPGGLGDEYLGLRARAHDALGDGRAAAADLAKLAERRPDDRAVALGAARALADCGRFADAELAYRRLLDRNAADADALLGLTGLFESLNRPGELATFFAAARAARADPAVVALGDVIASREAGKLAEALTALDAARGTLPEPSWQQMRGALSDSAGDADHAFAAFAAMNAADRAATTEAAEGVRLYRAELDAELAALDRPRPSSPPPEARPAPLFLLGFPRSGTTLIDTFLMGHGGVRVHEERPFLEAAARLGGSPSARAFLDPTQVAAMRAAYWHALDQESDRPDLLQIDKYPLASARAALIDALFPGAPILFMLRHPCDVVLSCFITRFRLNWGVAAFLSLDDTVAAYDRVMRVWIKAREQRSLRVHEVRYEDLITDPTRVLRGVAGFAGVDFDPAMLDHAETARARGHIATPSHAQVARPLYHGSAGRWRRYRSQLGPYLPLIEPWCDRFGYTLDE